MVLWVPVDREPCSPKCSWPFLHEGTMVSGTDKWLQKCTKGKQKYDLMAAKMSNWNKVQLATPSTPVPFNKFLTLLPSPFQSWCSNSRFVLQTFLLKPCHSIPSHLSFPVWKELWGIPAIAVRYFLCVLGEGKAWQAQQLTSPDGTAAFLGFYLPATCSESTPAL